MAFKFLQVVLLASFKYFLTVPYALLIGLDYELALLAILAGGIGGFLFFYYLSGYVTKGFRAFRPWLCRMAPPLVRVRWEAYRLRRAQHPRIHSRRNRLLVRLRKSYGLWGIVLATPVLLTIPVGAFLANRYYKGQKRVVIYMILSIIGWGVAFSGILQILPGVIK